VLFNKSDGQMTARRWIRTLLTAFVLIAANKAIAQVDTISHSPSVPTSTAPITLIVDGFNSVSPTGIYTSSFAVTGSTIRLYGCINASGFSTPSTYRIVYQIIALAPGPYVIEYYRATCDAQTGVITIIDPYQLMATTSMIVALGATPDPVPIDNKYLLLLLAVMVLALASRGLSRGRSV
jgi:hypothetical protein